MDTADCVYTDERSETGRLLTFEEWLLLERRRTAERSMPPYPSDAYLTMAFEAHRERQLGEVEDQVVVAALKVAEQIGQEERASFGRRIEMRSADGEAALRLVEKAGIPAERLAAYRSLARSRGVGLGAVIRHALRGELAAIVSLPTASRK